MGFFYKFPRVGKVRCYLMEDFEREFFECGKRKNTRKKRAFNMWIDKLFLIVSRVFVYENLPPNLPQWEIEKRLIINGNCFVFKNETYGVITSFGALSGVDIYNNANEFNYAQSILGSKSRLTNLVDGVIIYGTSIDKLYGSRGVIGKRIQYYADILSDIDVSRQVGLINNRCINSVVAKSDNALNELKSFYTRVQDGELAVPRITSGVLDATENILKQNNNSGYSLSEFDIAQMNILKLFYHDFGIAFSTEKRERLLTDEIAADNEALDINISDMLDCRQNGITAINNMFGTNITVGVINRDTT